MSRAAQIALKLLAVRFAALGGQRQVHETSRQPGKTWFENRGVGTRYSRRRFSVWIGVGGRHRGGGHCSRHLALRHPTWASLDLSFCDCSGCLVRRTRSHDSRSRLLGFRLQLLFHGAAS